MTSVRLAMLHACNTADPGRWANAEPIPPDDRINLLELSKRIHRANVVLEQRLMPPEKAKYYNPADAG